MREKASWLWNPASKPAPGLMQKLAAEQGRPRMATLQISCWFWNVGNIGCFSDF